ncbi:MAG: hypothetical protein Q8R35_03580 [bacterium]|nr:hypothetical protein [bacterium]
MIGTAVLQRPAIIARLRSGNQSFYLVRPAKPFGRVGLVDPPTLEELQPAPLPRVPVSRQRTDLTPA